jgi:branched-chain amino acid transport system substrate-binding protein
VNIHPGSPVHRQPANRVLIAVLFGTAVLITSICSGARGAADELVIGASIPLSGPLAAFGYYEKWGYDAAIADVNKAGGIAIGGTKLPVKLVIRDDNTNPSVAASNTETLISRDGATAMLGSCTPALVIPGALVAERHGVPLVTGCDPMRAFTSVRRWKYAWSIFFDEKDLVTSTFRMFADSGIHTNKKLAILHDNGPDGEVGGTVASATARQYGYELVNNASFPTDTSQFTSIIGEVKASGADVVLVFAITPQSILIRKQMAAAGFTPKVLVMEKGGEPLDFARALGKLSDGVITSGYWAPTFPYPGAAALAKRFESETRQASSQHIADANTAARVLLDAIAAAGSLDHEKINAAIAKTDKSYVVGPVKFDAVHFAKIPIAGLQWQATKLVVVWPKDRQNGQLIFPLP